MSGTTRGYGDHMQYQKPSSRTMAFLAAGPSDAKLLELFSDLLPDSKRSEDIECQKRSTQ